MKQNIFFVEYFDLFDSNKCSIILKVTNFSGGTDTARYPVCCMLYYV